MPIGRLVLSATAARASVLALLALVPSGRQPSAQCPTDTIVVCGTITTSSASAGSAFGCAFGSSGAIYDLIAGRISVNASYAGGSVRLRTEDIFVLSGPASPTPIQGTVKLAARFTVGFQQTLVLTLASGGQSVIVPASNGTFSTTLSVPFARLIGEPFDVVIDATARSQTGMKGSIPTARVTGDLFVTLPGGYTATSCQGYSSGLTASRRTTWGRVKTVYR